MTGCGALEGPYSSWNFCPSSGASYLFTVLFGLTTIMHTYQTFKYRKWYCWVISMAGAWQTIGYIARDLSIIHYNSEALYAIWFVLLLVSPLWTNAFTYMVVGRMVWNFTSDAKLWFIKAWRFGMIFVVLDIVAFVIQVYGAGSASTGQNEPTSQILAGLHIYMGGVGLQLFFIVIFSVFVFKLFRVIRAEQTGKTRKDALILLYVVSAVLVLISVRIIFRICEYAKGLDSTIPRHEAYLYVLDSFPMLIALVLFNVVHPGSIMNGPGSNIPSRKQRKGQNATRNNYAMTQLEETA